MISALKKDSIEAPKKMLCLILQALLNEAGMNSYELSKRLSMPYSTIHKMLNKPHFSPTVDTLKVVAGYFNVTIEQLIGDKPIEKLKHVKLLSEDFKLPPITNPKLEKPCNYKLLIECIKIIEEYTKKENKAFNLDKNLRIIKEIYQFSFIKNLDKPDKDFSEWFLENNA